jgi:hypothetical protein
MSAVSNGSTIASAVMMTVCAASANSGSTARLRLSRALPCASASSAWITATSGRSAGKAASVSPE